MGLFVLLSETGYCKNGQSEWVDCLNAAPFTTLIRFDGSPQGGREELPCSHYKKGKDDLLVSVRELVSSPDHASNNFQNPFSIQGKRPSGAISSRFSASEKN